MKRDQLRIMVYLIVGFDANDKILYKQKFVHIII